MEGPHILFPELGGWPIGIALAWPETHHRLQGMEKAFPRPRELVEAEVLSWIAEPGDL